MPKSRNQIKPEVAWPHLCSIGQKLAYEFEMTIDYKEKARGAQRIREATQAKQGAEDDLQGHIDKCRRCVDKPAEARERLLARARSARRVRPTRTPSAAPRTDQDQREPLRQLSRFRPRRLDGPEGDLVVQYAVFRLQGRII